MKHAFNDPRLIAPAIVGFAAGLLTWGQAHASQQYATNEAPTPTVETTAPITAPDIDPTSDVILPPVDALIYEDGSWTAGDESGCLPWGLCND